MKTQYRPSIHCGKCESIATTVTETRHYHQSIRRRRKCLACGHRFTTIELNAKHITTDPKFDFLFRQRKTA